MTSGFMDAGTGPAAPGFSVTDLIIYGIFLEMAWVLDPGTSGIDTSSPWWLSNHWWYLLTMLLCRLGVVVMHGFRIPAFAQVLLAASALFLLPANMVCLSASCSNESYVEWGQAGQPWRALFTIFYIGTEPQTIDFEYSDFKFAITRKYLLCVFLYVLAFHYGRPAARGALSLAGHLRTAINRIQFLPKTMRQLLPWGGGGGGGGAGRQGRGSEEAVEGEVGDVLEGGEGADDDEYEKAPPSPSDEDHDSIRL